MDGLGGNVSVNLQALIDFRNDLITFNQDLAERFDYIHSRWRLTGDAWRDRKYEEFGEVLDEANQGIRRYLAAAEQHEAYLWTLIEDLDAYLGRQSR